MQNRTAALLSLGACGVGFLAAWLIFRSEGTRTIDESVPSLGTQALQRAAREPRDTSEPPGLERPDSRVPAITEAPTVSEPPESPQPAAQAKPPITPGDPRSLPEGTLREMVGKRVALQSYLSALMTPIIWRRVEDGQFEHLSDAPHWTEGEAEKQRAELSTLTLAKGGGLNRVVLPRSEYPELYGYKDELNRLDVLIEAANPGTGQEDMRAPK